MDSTTRQQIIDKILNSVEQPIPLFASGAWDADIEGNLKMKIFYGACRSCLRDFLTYAFKAQDEMPLNARFAVSGLVRLGPKFYDADDCEVTPPDYDADEEHSIEQDLVDDLIDIDWTVRLEHDRLVFSHLRDDDNAEIWASVAYKNEARQ